MNSLIDIIDKRRKIYYQSAKSLEIRNISSAQYPLYCLKAAM